MFVIFRYEARSKTQSDAILVKKAAENNPYVLQIFRSSKVKEGGEKHR